MWRMTLALGLLLIASAAVAMHRLPQFPDDKKVILDLDQHGNPTGLDPPFEAWELQIPPQPVPAGPDPRYYLLMAADPSRTRRLIVVYPASVVSDPEVKAVFFAEWVTSGEDLVLLRWAGDRDFEHGVGA